MKATQTKIVSASGAMKRRSPWKVSLTWESTNSTTSSTKACALDGTPEVALRACVHIRKEASRPSASAITHESKWMVPNANSFVLWVRWWTM